MLIKDVNLDILATRISQSPEGDRPEFLLVGRSNVGKSSFINSVTGRRNIAHTSSKPGKTQTLNFYNVNDQFYIVDVPGYGYAATDKKTQNKFGMMIEEYLKSRENLKRVFMLVDFRHTPMEDDVLMYNFLKYYNIPVTVIATKADKVGGSKKEANMKDVLKKLDLVIGDDLIVFSSTTKLGVKDVLNKIDEVIKK